MTPVIMNVDADLVAAPDAELPPMDRLWAALGLPMDGVQRQPAPVSGPYRRLAAGLHSVASRRDGNAYAVWETAGPQDTDAWGRRTYASHLTWWSYAGSWGARAWHVSAKVLVQVDEDLETSMSLRDVTLAVSGRDGDVTVYYGDALAWVLAGPVRDRAARRALRGVAGVPDPDDDPAPDLKDWYRVVASRDLPDAAIADRVRRFAEIVTA
ncbi:MAG TPA: hypothetical protein VL652_34755 [Kutzneria sp.]|jgi:hypothetical protein|nr:hypothetical protein [Kutzneria sp.]